MQSRLFVFAGFQNDNSTDSLDLLTERLQIQFAKGQLPVSFSRKGRLLSSNFEDVSFYVSIFSDEGETKDWYQMAEDFELTSNPNPVSEHEFEKRLSEKEFQSPGLYEDGHNAIGRKIYEEMAKLDLVKIYFFS